MKHNVFVCILLACLSVSADIIYEQYGTNIGNSELFSYDNYYIGQDFTVSGDWFIDDITFNARTTTQMDITAVNYKFYTDVYGLPGDLIFEGTQTEILKAAAPGFDYTYSNYTFDVDQTQFSTGTYWLGLNVAFPMEGGISWTGTEIINSVARISVNNGITYPGHFNTDFMFSINGHTASVPEPSLLPLLLLSILVLGCVQIRRKLLKA